MNSTSGFIYNVLEWITRFAYVNLLWILFTLLGGILFGFYPATIAMFAVCRDWLRGDSDKPVFSSFWTYYRQDFLKSNRLGLFISAISAFIAIDIFYIRTSSEDLSWTYIPLFAFMLLFVMYLFYLFPSFVHFDIKLGKLIKNAFLIMLVNPVNTLLIFICLGSLAVIMQTLPALAFIFGGSTFTYIIMWLALRSFNRMTKPADTENEPAQEL